MDKDKSRKYESIDALIMAAEVLERAEALAKEQFALQDNQQICNCCDTNLNEVVIDKCKYSEESDKEDQLTEGLLQTIDYIKGLHTSEGWNELFEKKNKSDNRILYRELSDLKKKLNKMKGITAKSNQRIPTDKREEDEDTSTASEDEGYNKYDQIIVNDNGDDITDDASECEETTNPSSKSKPLKIGSSPQGIKYQKNKMKTVTPVDVLSNINGNTSRMTNRKRKYTYDVNESVVVTASSDDCMSSIHIEPTTDTISCTSLPLHSLDRHSAINYKALLKVQQPVDI